jgi:hypothetical protein
LNIFGSERANRQKLTLSGELDQRSPLDGTTDINAVFGGDDLDAHIGGQTSIQGGERGLHLAGQVLHKHARFTRLFERRVILVTPDIEILRQVLIGVAEAKQTVWNVLVSRRN